MSKINKIIKEGVNNLLENFEDMEVAFGTKKLSDLSDAEKNQFGPMGQLKTTNGGSFNNPVTNGMKAVNKANKQDGIDAQAYYKEVADKIRNYQKTTGTEKFDAPKVPTGGNDRLEVTGYDNGISGMEVTADLAAEKGGSTETKKVYKDRITKMNKGDKTGEKMMKNAKETNQLKYKKEANNTRPVKQTKSPQPMGESIKYEGVDSKNIFKANGKIVSEEQVIKLANKVPSRVKIDETTFAITDGENSYKLIWEGDSKTGEPVITNFKNTELVKEDIQEMKRLWNFKPSDSISTKRNITESGEDAFRRLLKIVKEDGSKKKVNEGFWGTAAIVIASYIGIRAVLKLLVVGGLKFATKETVRLLIKEIEANPDNFILTVETTEDGRVFSFKNKEDDKEFTMVIGDGGLIRGVITPNKGSQDIEKFNLKFDEKMLSQLDDLTKKYGQE